ncbi:MAG: RNA polymerase sigma factor [Proteobacteria bacterium]|nr:RNA polymerase sigma factor [Pseudomonadota bacterium]MCP4918597.1 RNA polymerase sigma factor [Pseudomonadota bacterium]
MLRRIRRFYSGDEAEDVLQEVFMRVVAKEGSFKGQSQVSTWLYQVTTRYCLNRRRNEGRRKELREEHGTFEWSPNTIKAQHEAKAFCAELWQRLDPELMQIGVHHYVDGMSHGEIARVMGVSRRTIGNRLEQLRVEAVALGGAS